MCNETNHGVKYTIKSVIFAGNRNREVAGTELKD